MKYYNRAVGTSFFFRAHSTSFHTHASLIFFVCFFLSCFSHVLVLGKHSYMSSTFPIAMLNVTCFFPTVQLKVDIVYSERKTRNSEALVNQNL